jgi:hypothetical protein
VLGFSGLLGLVGCYGICSVCRLGFVGLDFWAGLAWAGIALGLHWACFSRAVLALV